MSTSYFYYLLRGLKTAGSVINSVDPDRTPQNASLDQKLHVLLRHDFPNTLGKFGTSENTICGFLACTISKFPDKMYISEDSLLCRGVPNESSARINEKKISPQNRGLP